MNPNEQKACEQSVRNYYEEPVQTWRINSEVNIPYIEKLREIIGNQIKNKFNILEEVSLEKIYKFIDPSKLTNDNHGITAITQELYEAGEEFFFYYKKLTKHILAIFGDNYVIQRQPTIRAHFEPFSKYGFYPSWHSDLLLGHPPGTINLWMPFTRPDPINSHGFSLTSHSTSQHTFKRYCFDSPYDGVKLISKAEQLNQQQIPVKIEPGKALIFDSRTIHSGLPSDRHLRVSMDIRVINRRYLSPPNPLYRSGRKRVPFSEGYFYINYKDN